MSDVFGRKKINLLFVTTALYFGGAQKVTYILADALSDRYDVTVAYCFDTGRSHEFSEKCRIRKLPEFSSDANLPERMRSIREQIRTLKALKKELKIDAAISLGNVSNFINAMSKGDEQIICCERSNPKRSWGSLFFLTSLAFRRADHVVFQSERIRSLFGSGVRLKSSILKNPVLIPDPAAVCREKKIVAIGRLTAQKNQALLISAFAKFRERFPEYSLHIYGEGELERQLKMLIRSLEISGHVFLEGNDPDVHEKIRDAEMFVLSSDFEGLSNALLECMAMGISCISTKCEGSTDVIRNGENGLLADIGDESGLAQAMCTLAQDPHLRRRMERQAMEDMKLYARDLVVKDWECMILQCIRSGEKKSGAEKGGV